MTSYKENLGTPIFVTQGVGKQKPKYDSNRTSEKGYIYTPSHKTTFQMLFENPRSYL